MSYHEYICPNCHNIEHRAGARFCWVCGHGFPLDDRPVTEDAILRRAIKHYGRVNQLHVAMEEMSELTKELCKDLRGKPYPDGITEEMADVQIMLDQLQIMYGNTEALREARVAKLDRLALQMTREENS